MGTFEVKNGWQKAIYYYVAGCILVPELAIWGIGFWIVGLSFIVQKIAILETVEF